MYSLTDIARTMGKPYDIVYKDVKKMIRRRQLKNAYLDERTKQVVLVNSNADPAKEKQGRAKIVHCSSCGANSTINGKIGECEYCGSPLTGEKS